jgi:hypothetical protein
MRRRVEQFLQTRLRRMLAPATLGLGLAMTGCPSSALDATEDAGALVKKDGGADFGGPVAVYSAPAPDAGGPVANQDAGTSPVVPDVGVTPVKKDSGADFGGPVAVYSAPAPDAGPVATKYLAPVPDASREAPLPMPEYMAPLPDAAREVPMAQPDYMAQMPDSGPALRYMAQMPDAAPDRGGPMPLYLAQIPPQES